MSLVRLKNELEKLKAEYAEKFPEDKSIRDMSDAEIRAELSEFFQRVRAAIALHSQGVMNPDEITFEQIVASPLANEGERRVAQILITAEHRRAATASCEDLI